MSIQETTIVALLDKCEALTASNTRLREIEAALVAELNELRAEVEALKKERDQYKAETERMEFVVTFEPGADCALPFVRKERLDKAMASNARLREALVSSTDLLVRVEKAFTQAWCIDWNEPSEQAERNRKALEESK